MIRQFIWLIALCFILRATVGAQSRDPSDGGHNKGARKLELRSSTTTLTLDFVTPDRRGGVWLTGSAWMIRGLIVNDRDGTLTPLTVSGVRSISQPQFVTSDIGWMIDGRSLYRTKTAGLSWQQVKIPGAADISSVHFVDAFNGWVGGSGGQIYHTTDGGKSWKNQATGLHYEVTRIRFVDRLNGWASAFFWKQDRGGLSALLTTSDGGSTWSALSNEPTDSALMVRTFGFINASEGWALRNPVGDIMHTSDGGKTWILQYHAEDASLRDIFFLDSREGWALGDSILHTTDGGVSWVPQRKALPESCFLERIVFVDRKHGWAVGSTCAWRTNDGGINWQEMPSEWKQRISYDAMLPEQ
ncbi:MAG TPA: YCF48-related protein [Pyrinomonadaceae bacterium]|nr:YCF48-related protein [Pyrinomonadaceae bacterium]